MVNRMLCWANFWWVCYYLDILHLKQGSWGVGVSCCWVSYHIYLLLMGVYDSSEQVAIYLQWRNIGITLRSAGTCGSLAKKLCYNINLNIYMDYSLHHLFWACISMYGVIGFYYNMCMWGILCLVHWELWCLWTKLHHNKYLTAK